MDVINQGMLFAATLLLCYFPFLIVASALAGKWAAQDRLETLILGGTYLLPGLVLPSGP